MTRSAHLFFEEDLADAPPPAARPATARPAAPPRNAPAARPADAAEPHDAFFVWLLRRGGLSVERYRPTSLGRRLNACLRAVGATTTDAAVRAIEADPLLLRRALNAVLLGVTEFYRDRNVFDALRDEVLPDLLRHRPGVRAWSAGCSDGHELYSLAILLAEAGCLERCELLGTDCRSEAIDRARAGLFAAEAVAALGEGRAARHFADEGRWRRASGDLRSRLRWSVADLLVAAERGPWDLILWRNMAIYLRPEAAETVWHALLRELRPGGYLVTGKADHPPALPGLRRVAASIYRRET